MALKNLPYSASLNWSNLSEGLFVFEGAGVEIVVADDFSVLMAGFTTDTAAICCAIRFSDK